MPPNPPTLQLVPIGVVHSPWRAKHSAPRQPAAAQGVTGSIELFANGEFEHALSDLDAWSHIWVLFWFHLNTSWHAKVLPPRSHKKRGVFATRSPHRPNPLGLSVLELLRVEGRVLHVRNLDILDQTPVFDIKPYLAYTDAPAGANAGWLRGGVEAVEAQGASHGDPVAQYQVEWDATASAQLAWLGPQLSFDLREAVEAVLSVGPTPHPYRRIRVGPRGSMLAVKDFRIQFAVQGFTVRIHGIGSGYRARVLKDPRAVASESTPLCVHRAFMAQFGDKISGT
jgi:tRNA-Thr(GGU) m(6)t(6)A37 methyltransferase TsaA